MYYIQSTPDAGGNYGPPQSNCVGDMVLLPDELVSAYIDTMGFAKLTVNNGAVSAVEVNKTAYDAYQEAHPPTPEPEPIPSEIEVLRAEVASLSVATTISFVALAEAGGIDDVTAGEHTELFASWAGPVAYKVGDIRRYGGGLYRCIQDHTSQADWTPDAAPSLWSKIADPAEEWPEWSQPVGAHDAYNAGDKVSHNGKHWASSADGNVWEPGAYGWEMVKEANDDG